MSQLILSTGPLETTQIQAMNLNTIHKGMDGDLPIHAIAVWLKDTPDPRYFPRLSMDAQALTEWAKWGDDAFLLVPRWHLFARDAVARVTHGWDQDLPVIEVHLTGIALPFVFDYDSQAADFILAQYQLDTVRVPAIA